MFFINERKILKERNGKYEKNIIENASDDKFGFVGCGAPTPKKIKFKQQNTKSPSSPILSSPI